MKQNRMAEIRQILTEENQINNLDICSRLNISLATLRRYLDQLEQEGLIRRIYGGAVLCGASGQDMAENTPLRWDIRQSRNTAEKQALARAAVERIPENCTVFIDTSTSAFEVAKLLAGRENITVLTNSLRSAGVLSTNEKIQVYCLGGYIHPGRFSISGMMAAECLALAPDIDICILSADGFSPSGGLRDFSMESALMKRAVIKRSKAVIALLDHSKFSVKADVLLCPTQQIDTIVTSRKTPPQDIQCLQEMQIHTITVS